MHSFRGVKDDMPFIGDGLLFVAQDIGGLMRVQFTRFPVGIHPVPVVHPVGDIRRLLHFDQHHAAHNGVEGAGRNENKVVCGHFYVSQIVFHCAFSNGFFVRGPVRKGVPVVDGCPWIGLDDVPRLCFTVIPLVLLGVCVVRVNLYRQVLFSVDKLH